MPVPNFGDNPAQDHLDPRNKQRAVGGIHRVKRWCVAVTAAATMMLVGCGSDSATSPDPASTTQPSPNSTTPTPTSMQPSSTAMQEPESVATPETQQSALRQEPVQAEPVTVQEPVIVDCQPGMGPIITYWSDGSVTGYSDYCQSVHDQALAEEVAANTPVCDGTICTYPSGVQVTDPSANRVVVPYTCGYDVLCDEAGNVIPGPESGVKLGNGWTCAGNGCTRPY